jgi:hypothetical protein
MREEQAAKYAELEAHIPLFKDQLEELFNLNQDTWEMEATLCKGLRLFRTVCNNIIKSPNEQKFRTLNSANNKIAAELFSLKGSVDVFVTTAGFV